MGTVMNMVALCLLPALLACALATEVENLAPSHVEELGATLKTGGFFSALQTSGSFTMMQAGGFEELGDSSSSYSSAATATTPQAAAVAAVVKNPAQCAPQGALQCAAVVQCPEVKQSQCTGTTQGEKKRAKAAKEKKIKDKAAKDAKKAKDAKDAKAAKG